MTKPLTASELIQKTCRRCGALLDTTNCYPSRIRKRDWLCNDCSKKTKQTYYLANRGDIIASVNRYTLLHHERKLETLHNWRLRLKMDVLTHYSGGTPHCVGWNGVECPSHCTDIRCLTIDHINGGGNAHRKLVAQKGSSSLYKWLRDNNYPEGFQTLCMNCQRIKVVENKEWGVPVEKLHKERA